ncbi:hypothetical protein C8F01DRAFT_1245387 [Mycena amicta]|nr:hypothetical protein C8F01DRAFT_1245387 [Mycena amicta]
MLSTTRAVVPANDFLPHGGCRVRAPSSSPTSGKRSTPVIKRLIRFVSAAFESTPMPKVQPRPYRTLQGIPIQDLRPPRFVPPSAPVEGSAPNRVIPTQPLSMSRSTCTAAPASRDPNAEAASVPLLLVLGRVLR